MVGKLKWPPTRVIYPFLTDKTDRKCIYQLSITEKMLNIKMWSHYFLEHSSLIISLEIYKESYRLLYSSILLKVNHEGEKQTPPIFLKRLCSTRKYKFCYTVSMENSFVIYWLFSQVIIHVTNVLNRDSHTFHCIHRVF